MRHVKGLCYLVGYDYHVPPSIGNYKIACLIYADDIVLLSMNKKGLKRSLNKLQEFSHLEQLKINYTKSKVMIFGKHPPKFSWTVGENKISPSLLVPRGAFWWEKQLSLLMFACTLMIAYYSFRTPSSHLLVSAWSSVFCTEYRTVVADNRLLGLASHEQADSRRRNFVPGLSARFISWSAQLLTVILRITSNLIFYSSK